MFLGSGEISNRSGVQRVSSVRSGVDSGIGDIDGGEDGGSTTGVSGTVTVIGSVGGRGG